MLSMDNKMHGVCIATHKQLYALAIDADNLPQSLRIPEVHSMKLATQ